MKIEFTPEEQPEEVNDNVVYLEPSENSSVQMIEYLEYLLGEAKLRKIKALSLIASFEEGEVLNTSFSKEGANLYAQLGLLEEAKADILEDIRECSVLG